MRNEPEIILANYRRSRSEEEFKALVDLTIDQVHSTALRVTRNEAMAEDVTQNVFLRLATKPGSVPTRIPLGVWLHRTTTSLAIDLVRSEERRRKRAARYAEANPPDPMNWSKISPEVDEALEELSEADRSAIILRYFENRSLRQIAEALGIQEKSAHMRVTRALEKLRAILARRGITTSAAFLSTSLGAHAVGTAPAHLNSAIVTASQAAFTGGPLSSTLGITSLIMNTKTFLLPAACVTLLAVSAWQRSTINERRQALESSDPDSRARAATLTRDSSRDRADSGSHSSQDALVSHARRLAEIEPLGAREAALLEWAGSFETADQIIELAAILRETSSLTPQLRTRVAEALTARWATLDPEGALNAHAESYLSTGSSPFGQSDNERSGLGVIAANDSEAFTHWVEGNPAIVIDLLNGTSGFAVIDVAQYAPTEFLGVLGDALQEGRKVEPLKMLPELFGKALASKAGSAEQAWAYFDEKIDEYLGAEFMRDIATQIALADPRSREEVLSELAARTPDWSTSYRLETAGDRLARDNDELGEGETAARDQWWSDFEAYGNLINSSAGSSDPRFDNTRRKMAALGSREDKEAGILWANSIIDPETRRLAAAEVALEAHGISGYSYNARKRGFEKWVMHGGYRSPDNSEGPDIDLPSDLSTEETVIWVEGVLEETTFEPGIRHFGGFNPSGEDSIREDIKERSKSF